MAQRTKRRSKRQSKRELDKAMQFYQWWLDELHREKIRKERCRLKWETMNAQQREAVIHTSKVLADLEREGHDIYQPTSPWTLVICSLIEKLKAAWANKEHDGQSIF